MGVWVTACWAALALLGGCGDDAAEDGGSSNGQTSTNSGTTSGTNSGTQAPLYVLATDIASPDTQTTYLVTMDSLEPAQAPDLSQGTPFVGGAWMVAYEGSVFVGTFEDYAITRYEVQANGGLTKGQTVSFLNRGLDYLGRAGFCSPTRAFLVNEAQYEIIEWDPSTMTITNSYDMRGALERDGWAYELRRFPVCSGGKVYFYWTYTNERTEFIDNLTVGAFDIETKQTTLIEDDTCSSSSGYGGYLDEQGDFYAFADNFGSFTLFGNNSPKPACVRRIRSGQAQFDPSFRVELAPLMGGLRPFGLWYSSGGVAYTSGMDTSLAGNYDSPFEFIFDDIHALWRVDLGAGEGSEAASAGRSGVGFAGFAVDGLTVLPRTTGEVEIFDITAAETSVYGIDPADNSARVLFKVPGEIYTIERIR